MSKHNITKALIFIFLIIFNLNLAYAKLNANNIVCSETGYLSFELNYRCSKDDCPDNAVKPFSRINITAESGGKKFKIIGVDTPLRLVQSEPYDFVSRDDILEPKRDYQLILFDGEEKTEYSVTCPDFKIRCSKINLEIDYCSEQELDFNYLFHGLGNEFSEKELREDIDYYINPARVLREHQQALFKQSEALPSSFIVKDLGFDRYVLQVPSLDLKNKFLDDIYIEVKNCDKTKFNVSDYYSCQKQKCYKDKNCPIGSYCDLENNKCNILNCNACETLSNNKCVSTCSPRNKCEEATCQADGCKYTRKENCCLTESDCNDALVCTQDICENNKCVNSEIKCKASDDPCVVGVCEEPNGCKYIRNPECEKKEEVAIKEEEKKSEIQLNFPKTLKSVLGTITENQKLSFNFLGKDYSIVSENVGRDYIDLQVGDKTERINIKGTKEIDVDEDGKNDLIVSLKDIENGKANLEFTKLEETSKKSSFAFLGIALIIVLLLAGGGFYIVKIKKPKKEVETVKEQKIKKPTSDISISVSNFTLRHGKSTILENVSFDVQKGESVCLLGPSGTGKSTIIEALVGRKTPTRGTLKILGEDISKNKKIYDCVGFVPQNTELYMNQTVMQNLLSSATKWGIKDANGKAEKILSKIGLSNRKDLKANKLSGGQQKLLSLGMELIRDIELCILDEPTTGLDPNTRNNIITILSQISTQSHKTIFFTTHFMDDAEECDNVIILSDKKIVAQGPPSKLEKMLPGGGKVINVILDNVTDDLLEKIENIEGVKKIVREGRNLRIITEEPNAIKLGQKIDEVGGVVNETKIDRATMMEVFVYYTGEKPKENEK